MPLKFQATLFRIAQSTAFLFLAATVPGHSAPNIVMVFIDDMGWGDFSCFGNAEAQTPHVDRLAEGGIVFEQFYVNAPICSPSRVALTTGTYPQRWHIESYLSNRKANHDRGIADWLDPRSPSLARILKQEEGYATGHFGKWHMGGQRDVDDAPLITEYGFDESLTNFEGLGPRVLPILDDYDGDYARRYSLGADLLSPGPVIWEERAYVTKTFTEAALNFVRRAESKGKPFYVNLWPDDVHTPLFPPKGKRGDESTKQLYHGVLEAMDEQLGILFDHIRSSDTLRNNTLILVCSDNGPHKGAGSAGPFRGYKTTLFEGGIRSPLVIWGPGYIQPERTGSRNTSSVFSAMDLVPSLLSLSDVSPTTTASHAFDGEDISGTLTGERPRSRSAPLYFRRPPDRDAFYGLTELPDLALRSGKWKFLCEFDGSRPLLFDLSKDPGETTNLAPRQPVLAQSFMEQLIAWHENMPASIVE
ncbi:sulfatase-like hydrolase/transferase [Pelagicoccus enzymogenes]|uniref:sulfatase-like hydrolase/transferase n=1 Tax=Pelagicoccus enzymogenes TaxID=2773457 RepID=UPI00280FFB40|nr:sulfatase-like hydrolase/transferase [Pelagicoccus enzymogenes]MDQ8199402.1 sulfatase-like hydrolase/transferase [Pelagicoccus enzymogenes]